MGHCRMAAHPAAEPASAAEADDDDDGTSSALLTSISRNLQDASPSPPPHSCSDSGLGSNPAFKPRASAGDDGEGPEGHWAQWLMQSSVI